MSIEESKIISNTLETLKTQHNELKATTHGISADIVNIKKDIHTIIQVAKRLDTGLLGDVDLNQEGLFKQVKNQSVKHDQLECRVTVIENLKSTEDSLTKYKKRLISIIFVNLGVCVIWIIEKVLTFIHDK